MPEAENRKTLINPIFSSLGRLYISDAFFARASFLDICLLIFFASYEFWYKCFLVSNFFFITMKNLHPKFLSQI